ncbi:MAG: hypothetical protein L0H53_16890, partial [Candidatus Nitrosocosmicus sp.]|nr:hypothetical protein [Candidatus Nitrosocosmicus sp.]MDN5868648.1 hypothetical protein [Candidatus Nitrosocosmicus sp.]
LFVTYHNKGVICAQVNSTKLIEFKFIYCSWKHKSLKYLITVFILAIGLLSLFSVLTYSVPSASALRCDFHTNPYGGGYLDNCQPPGQLERSMPTSWPWSSQLNADNNIIMLNPQPLPPVDCPMCGAVVLDKSIFEIAPEIKITPQKDGSILLSTSNSTEVVPNSSLINSTSYLTSG